MSISIRAEHYLPCIIAGCLLFPAWAAHGQGLDEGKDAIPQIMEIVKTAQEVTVTIVPPYWESNVRIERTELWGGCTFTTRDALRIASLVDVLRQASLEIAKNKDEWWENEPREGIFMTLPDNNNISFEFGIKYLNQDEVRGYFIYSSHGKKILVTADGALPHNLYIWSDAGSLAANTNAAQGPCDNFFASVRNSK